MAKDKDKEKGKQDAKAEKTVRVTISAHPRAKAGVRRARTRAALIAFILVLVLNLVGGQTPFDAVWRALLAGIVVNVIAWRCAIVVWRHILRSELEQLRATREERAREQREAFERSRGGEANARAS
jgi:uncharacterized membrane protein YccC